MARAAQAQEQTPRMAAAMAIAAEMNSKAAPRPREEQSDGEPDPEQETEPEREDTLSVISSDASPRDSVFEFLAGADSAGFALFTPPPQTRTRAARSVSMASIGSSPGAAGSRPSSTTTSPSQFFRSPVRTRRTPQSVVGSGGSARRRAAKSPITLRTPVQRQRQRKRSTDEVRIKEKRDSTPNIKQEVMDDLVNSFLSPWPRSSTPNRSARSRDRLSTPSPPSRPLSMSLSRRLKDAFDRADPDAETDETSDLRDSLADAVDLFSAPSGLAGEINEHDSFFSFANSLSPLVNSGGVETSFLSASLSPLTSGSYDMPRLLPPFPLSRADGDQEDKASATPLKTPNQRRSHQLDGSSGGSSASALLAASFPNIKASTSAMPGKSERSKLDSHAIMKLKLHSPFAPVSAHSKRDFQAINNSLKRKSFVRKRKLEEKRSTAKLSAPNVQRKLLQTPVKSPARSPANLLKCRVAGGRPTPTLLPALHGRDEERVPSSTSARSLLPEMSEEMDRLAVSPTSTPPRKRKLSGSPGVRRSNLFTPLPTAPPPPKKLALSYSRAATTTTPPRKVASAAARQRVASEWTQQQHANGNSKLSETPLVALQTPVKMEVKSEVLIEAPSLSKPKKAPCNCKKSKCLKLYCECFASGGYCDESCNCVGCANTPASEVLRQQAINARLEKNPNAFKPKIASATTVAVPAVGTPQLLTLSSSGGPATFSTPLATHRLLFSHGSGGVKKMHKNGCHCKKSACQKKYCECFQAGVPCGDNCRCIDCKNQAPCVTHASPAAPVAMTPSHEIEETFVSPVLQGVRKRLRIDHETWAKNFSSPFESSPGTQRQRTARFRSRLNAATSGALTAVSGASPSSSSGPLSVRLRPVSSTLSTPVSKTAKRPRLASAFSPLREIPLAPAPVGSLGPKHRKQRVSGSTLDDKLLTRPKSNQVFVLPLFGAEAPPVESSVSAKIFQFLTNADVHNASLVSRLWSQVALGPSVWDHANFIPAGASASAEDERQATK